ncbi:hypothetical protein J0895_23750 [Phormidium pseudopriestleyi FRX01]|uniref:WD40 repeat domain-containing protein n=1 Tax=Phormidium pseudopriestleyi FRX01 TaxID=1759528 RepID=A0ABS3FY57_9CYAN|nr:hypothetical protein [Phormidium pseudopriestleyi]MBO0352041.1 hypothetical protein [Phormidium pseudopriestleyi FRX01]
MRKVPPFFLAAATTVLILLIALLSASTQWRPVKTGILFGISGIALVENSLDEMGCPPATCFVIVHDNKIEGDGRIAILTVHGQDSLDYLPRPWPDGAEWPIDLEAIARVPDSDDSAFMAVTSSGRVYHFTLDSTGKIQLIHIFSIPNLPENSNLEGFDLHLINGQLLAVWGHRGSSEDSGVLYWGWFDWNDYQISPQGSALMTVPWPEEDVRHISDLKVNNAGILYISSSRDPGNDGPFDSAVYAAGLFSMNGDQIEFRPASSLAPLYPMKGHKIEALEFLPGLSGGKILGTDDENQGSYIYLKR